MFIRNCALILILGFTFQNVASAMPILDIRDGILFGASGVDVEGTLYDVEFVDGSCTSVYGTCSESEFVFFTGDFSLSDRAAQSLAAQVFEDGPLGNFDTDLDIVNGCLGAVGFCNILTASIVLDDGEFAGSSLSNAVDPFGDEIIIEFLPIDFDTTPIPLVFARWNLASTVAVPEPSAMALFLIALVTIRLTRRHHT